MNRTYKLLRYLLLGIGVYAFLNANNTNVIATVPKTKETTQLTPNRHTITLVLNELEVTFNIRGEK